MKRELEDVLVVRNKLENDVAMLATEIERYKYKLNNRTNESQ
jgi:uncharacterized small protein (DUF1192 family)